MRLSAVAAVALVVTLAAAAASTAPVYAFLLDNSIVRTDARLAAWKRVRIGPPAREPASSGTLLAASRDGRSIWVLDRAGNRLVRLGLDLSLRQVVALPRGWSPRALAVGARSGDVYVAYNRVFPSHSSSRHDDYRSAWLAAFDSRGRGPLHDLRLRPRLALVARLDARTRSEGADRLRLLMAFALDRAADRVFAVGSCGYVPGFSALVFSTGERIVLSHARNVCGEELVAAGGSVVVGSLPLPVASPDIPGALLRVDPDTGRLLRRRATPAEPVALLALRSDG